MDPLLGVLPDVCPWVRFLPEPDLHAMAVELAGALRAAQPPCNNTAVVQLLIAWRHSAEVHSDPVVLAALTTDRGEDHGPAPDPRDSVRSVPIPP